MDNGATVIVCAIFFVILALFRQNVMIFVPHNLNRNIKHYEATFRAFDLDKNGVIDQDEFFYIGRMLQIEHDRPEGEIDEPEIGVRYIDIAVSYPGDGAIEPVDGTVTFAVRELNQLRPSYLHVGYSWVLFKGYHTPTTSYFPTPITRRDVYYPLHRLLSALHWNPALATRSTPVSAAMVTGLSDSHVKVALAVNVEYQLARPPDTPLWRAPCALLTGHVVWSRDLTVLEGLSLGCGGEEGGEIFRSRGGSYRYRIQNSGLVAIPVTVEGVSDQWYREEENWLTLLNTSYF